MGVGGKEMVVSGASGEEESAQERDWGEKSRHLRPSTQEPSMGGRWELGPLGQEGTRKAELQKGPKEGKAFGQRAWSPCAEAPIRGGALCLSDTLPISRLRQMLGYRLSCGFVQALGAHPRAWLRNGIKIEIWKYSFPVFLRQV